MRSLRLARLPVLPLARGMRVFLDAECWRCGNVKHQLVCEHCQFDPRGAFPPGFRLDPDRVRREEAAYREARRGVRQLCLFDTLAG